VAATTRRADLPAMSLDSIVDLAGEWRGSSRLRDPDYGLDERSASRATVTPVLGGRFVRLDYTWSYGDEPQEGSLLMGHDPSSGACTGHWIDSWHNAHRIMACQGGGGADGAVRLTGSYPAPSGPDWGWRIEVGPDDGGGLRVVMFNISPDGREELAVEGTYERAPGQPQEGTA
jgi:hypothetical protein